jgi:uncharacterized membrane protein YuzA (DUF378 family)
MANMIGEAARYTTNQSIRVFQRMLISTMLMMAAIGVFEGVDFSVIVLRWGQTGWAYLGFALLGLAGVFYLCRYQSRRIDRYERERKKWRKGAVGECVVADVLSALSDHYSVINGLNTASGDIDHVVVGPTGIFAIETKNWRGTVTADGAGDLVLNGLSTPQVRKFVRRTMAVREQVITLTHRKDLFIKAVMVFPRARVDAPFGTTSHAHCLTDEHICEYIEDPKYAHKLDSNEVELIVRAFTGIAAMDAGFSQHSTAAVKRSDDDPAFVTAASPDRA